MKKDLVSVIITTKNEQDVIYNLLLSIKKQSYQNIEVILVDNNSSDNTIKIAQEFTKKIYNFGPERSAQRNFGIKKAQGEYIFVVDADMVLSKDVCSSCVKLIKCDKTIGAVIIPEVSIGDKFWEKVKAFERSFYNESGDETTDAARFFKKSLVEKVGGYDESITGPEDWDLPEKIKKLGFKVERVKTVIYHKERIDSVFDLVRKKFYYGLKAYRYLEKQQIKTISPKTVYFLRPTFYKNWRKLLRNPMMSVAMFTMFFLELLGGGSGFLIGKFKKL